jgi:nondiscriminating aspartyl-tRNA synthetase
MRIRSFELSSYVGQRVCIAGWLHALRRVGALSFAVVRDGWGTVQAVGGDGLDAPLESVVEIEGQVVARPAQDRAGPASSFGPQLELHDVTLHVREAAEPPSFPLGKRQLALPLPALLDHAVVANRHPTRRAVFRLAAAAMRGFRRALDGAGFTEIASPKLLGSATEGGANVFALDYFGQRAFLAQSPQLYKQVMVGVFERVYEVGPVFRAEPHATARHLSQYTSLDVEMGFITNHEDVMRQLALVVRAMVGELAATCGPELALLGAKLPEVPAEVPAVHFTEVQQHEPDLSPEDERRIGRWAQETHGSDFVFVVGYPMAKRPFYTHPDPERPASSNSFDLLFRGTELVTGGQRLHRHADYLAALASRGMSAEPLAWYLEAFRHGMPPHGGFAIGLERFVMQLLGLSNIRLATLFPRDLDRLAP